MGKNAGTFLYIYKIPYNTEKVLQIREWDDYNFYMMEWEKEIENQIL